MLLRVPDDFPPKARLLNHSNTSSTHISSTPHNPTRPENPPEALAGTHLNFSHPPKVGSTLNYSGRPGLGSGDCGRSGAKDGASASDPWTGSSDPQSPLPNPGRSLKKEKRTLNPLPTDPMDGFKRSAIATTQPGPVPKKRKTNAEPTPSTGYYPTRAGPQKKKT